MFHIFEQCFFFDDVATTKKRISHQDPHARDRVIYDFKLSLGFANHIRIHLASGHNGCCDAEDPLSIVKITPSSPCSTPEDTAPRKTITGKNIGPANAFHTPFVFYAQISCALCLLHRPTLSPEKRESAFNKTRLVKTKML